MEIIVNDNKLRRALEQEAFCRRHYGADMAKKIRLRLTALTAAESLFDFWPPKSGPERCHELKGELAGTFSIDLKQPYRLLFKPREVVLNNEHSDQTSNQSGHDDQEEPDEQERWKAIKAVEILKIEDTHG